MNEGPLLDNVLIYETVARRMVLNGDDPSDCNLGSVLVVARKLVRAQLLKEQEAEKKDSHLLDVLARLSQNTEADQWFSVRPRGKWEAHIRCVDVPMHSFFKGLRAAIADAEKQGEVAER
jgi:hypothetical protein